eukprot:4745051-Amphidinium_carterae.2
MAVAQKQDCKSAFYLKHDEPHYRIARTVQSRGEAFQQRRLLHVSLLANPRPAPSTSCTTQQPDDRAFAANSSKLNCSAEQPLSPRHCMDVQQTILASSACMILSSLQTPSRHPSPTSPHATLEAFRSGSAPPDP